MHPLCMRPEVRWHLQTRRHISCIISVHPSLCKVFAAMCALYHLRSTASQEGARAGRCVTDAGNLHTSPSKVAGCGGGLYPRVVEKAVLLVLEGAAGQGPEAEEVVSGRLKRQHLVPAILAASLQYSRHLVHLAPGPESGQDQRPVKSPAHSTLGWFPRIKCTVIRCGWRTSRQHDMWGPQPIRSAASVLPLLLSRLFPGIFACQQPNEQYKQNLGNTHMA